MSEVLPVSGIFFYGDAILLQYVSASFLPDSDRLSRWHSERCRANESIGVDEDPGAIIDGLDDADPDEDV
jgi:hypothetical protein